MSEIFISYRRSDAADAAGRMFDRLAAAFGEGSVFKDVDSIPVGADFSEVIAERLGECRVVIVVIGRTWLQVRKQNGISRLQEPGDYVRLEIEHALASGALVVPALVGNAAMPRKEQLPPSIRNLVQRNAIAIRPDPDFHKDMDRLIEVLERHAPARKSNRKRPANSAMASSPEAAPAAAPRGWTLRLFLAAMLSGLVAVGLLAAAVAFEANTVKTVPDICGYSSIVLAVGAAILMAAVVFRLLWKALRWLTG